VPPDVTYIDLSDLCPFGQGQKSISEVWAPTGQIVVPSVKVTMRMIVDGAYRLLTWLSVKVLGFFTQLKYYL
jgi:hypothetical protein